MFGELGRSDDRQKLPVWFVSGGVFRASLYFIVVLANSTCRGNCVPRIALARPFWIGQDVAKMFDGTHRIAGLVRILSKICLCASFDLEKSSRPLARHLMRKNPATLNMAKARWRKATEIIVHISHTRDRWKGAVENVITLQKLLRFYDAVQDRESDPRARLYAVVQLAIYFRDDKDIKHKIFKIRRRLHQVSYLESVMQNITRIGTALYEWFTPSRIGKHRLWFTPSFVIVAICTYSYMLADYRNYESLPYGWHIGSSLSAKFDSTFLNTWKAFNTYSVIEERETQRWFISWIEHEGLQHIVSNLLLFVVLAGHLEHQYGTTRIVFISVVSGVGGKPDECCTRISL